jgi:hypothetical protein
MEIVWRIKDVGADNLKLNHVAYQRNSGIASCMLFTLLE